MVKVVAPATKGGAGPKGPQRVQKVQRVVVAASRQLSKKRGAPDGAGCVEGLCSLSSGGDSGFAAEGKVTASP